jgi:hypothetical protein
MAPNHSDFGGQDFPFRRHRIPCTAHEPRAIVRAPHSTVPAAESCLCAGHGLCLRLRIGLRSASAKQPLGGSPSPRSDAAPSPSRTPRRDTYGRLSWPVPPPPGPGPYVHAPPMPEPSRHPRARGRHRNNSLLVSHPAPGHRGQRAEAWSSGADRPESQQIMRRGQERSKRSTARSSHPDTAHTQLIIGLMAPAGMNECILSGVFVSVSALLMRSSRPCGSKH